MRGETGLYRRIIGAADGDFRTVSGNDMQTTRLFTQGDDVSIGNPVGSVHLHAFRLAYLFQCIGKTQQNELLPARGDDLRIVILHR